MGVASGENSSINDALERVREHTTRDKDADDRNPRKSAGQDRVHRSVVNACRKHIIKDTNLRRRRSGFQFIYLVDFRQPFNGWPIPFASFMCRQQQLSLKH